MNCHLFRIPALVLTAAIAGACTPADTPPDDPGADLVFRNGKVYTVDGERTWAEAVAVSAGRIVYVGSDAGLQDHVGSNTRSVDLKGRMLLPGFQDAHVHPISGGVEASACDLNQEDSVQGYLSVITRYAAAHPDEPWILGGGWLLSTFGSTLPSRSMLDAIVADRPVFLDSSDGHMGWANSKALEMAGIDNDTPDPIDGRIDRDPGTGKPTGTLQEGAMKMISRIVPPLGLQERVSGLEFAAAMLNAYGITSIQEARIDPGYLEAYQALERRGQLNLRVVASQKWNRDRGEEQIEEFIAARKRYSQGSRLRASTVKIFLDGVIENFTAALLEPYILPDENYGITMVETALLNRVVTRLDAEKFQVHFHAIGDAAVRQALDAIAEAREQNGDLGNRHHIAHLQLIDPADIPRFAELDVVANFQPLWAYADTSVTELTIPFIGEERARWMYPIRSVEQAGGRIAFGSDWSVSSADPLPQIETAVTRMSAVDDSIPVFIPEERIRLESAIAAFTINAAFVNHREQDTGSLEVGKLADLVVIDRNLFEIPPAEISAAKVLLTVLEGQPVYGDIDAL